MRLATLLLLLVSATASAQPDPTPPEAYYPLHVGNQWEYGPESGSEGPPISYGFPYERRTVSKDTVVAGRTYAVVRRQRFGYADGQWYSEEDRSLVRFDTSSASVRVLTGEGERDLFGCRLDLPSYNGSCEGEGPYTYYSVSLFAGVSVGSDYVFAPLRILAGEAPTPRLDLVAGVGEVVRYGEWTSFPEFVAEYARVDDVEYGERISGLPDEAPPPSPGMSDPDPAGYYPLAIGDLWEYISEAPFPFPQYQYVRRTILSDTLVLSRRYAVERFERFTRQSGNWTVEDSRNLVRFDTATASVRVLDGGDERDLFGCRLDLPFPSGECSGEGPFLFYSGTLRGLVRFGNELIHTSTRSFDGLFPGPTLALGIGDMGRGCEGGCVGVLLAYANVGGVEYGQRSTFPISTDEPASLPAVLTLHAAPNPTAGPLALIVTLPEAQAVTAEAFDALGRRVSRVETVLPAGQSVVPVDAGAWAPGLYVVRVSIATAAATARVVRQ